MKRSIIAIFFKFSKRFNSSTFNKSLLNIFCFFCLRNFFCRRNFAVWFATHVIASQQQIISLQLSTLSLSTFSSHDQSSQSSSSRSSICILFWNECIRRISWIMKTSDISFEQWHNECMQSWLHSHEDQHDRRKV